jgi:DNA-binding beta-propeller fold protein YncE
MLTHALAASLTVFMLVSSPGLAQVPEVTPGFPTDHTCEPGQLLYRQVGLGRIGNMIYHNGVMLTNNVAGGNQRWWRFDDPNDPATLGIYATDVSVPTDQGTHSHTKLGDYVCGGWGCRVRSEGPGQIAAQLMPASAPGEILAGFTPQNQPEAPDSGLHRLYYPWAVPFNWIQYGVNAGTGRLWRGDQLLAEWEPLADHGVSGNGILIGNYLFIVSDGAMLGVVAYDISPVFDDPPGPPQFLDKLAGSFGAYIGAVWENYLVLAGGEPRHLLYVIDYSDPSDLRLVTTMDLTGDPALNAGTNVPYVQTQDEFVFTRRHKINMETLTPVLELDEVGDHRPAGSVSGPLDVSQYKLPLGNLLISGAYSFGDRDGVGVWCHQAEPDTRAPYVGYHIPRPNQTHYPLGAPVSLVIAETLESFTIINGETIILRPVGGEPVEAWVSFAHDGILTLTPYEYLEPDTSYELIVVAGGIKDAAGNGIEGYSFSFSTGSKLGGGNAAPEIESFTLNPSPIEPGQSVTLSAQASDPENDPIEFRFNFGDGSPSTSWSATSQVSHVYTDPGHYEAKLQVRDIKPDGSSSVVTTTRTLTVATIPQGPLPTHSGTITVDPDRRQVWVINPDNDSVSRLDADSGDLLAEVPLRSLLDVDDAVTPWSISLVPDSGQVWLALAGADGLLVLDATGQLVEFIDTGYGSAPQAVATSPDGSRVFASLHARGQNDPGNGQLLRFNSTTRTETGRLELGPSAGAIAISGSGAQLFVARFIATEHFGEVWQVNADSMSLVRSIELWRDRGRSGLDGGGSHGPGVPNYVSSLVIDPHQDWLWYTAIKMDTNRGLFFDQDTGLNLPFSHDSTVRPMLGRIDLNPGVPIEPGVSGTSNARIDANNSDSPSALAFAPRGNYVFASLQGNDLVAIFDDLAIQAGGGRASLARLGVGRAPRGLAWDEQTDSLWVQNFMSRDVSRIELADFLADGSRQFPTSHHVSSLNEQLAPAVLAGKQHFYFAGNHPEGVNEMSFEGYISCASCHVDGRHDGRTWDFTQRGEGLRNTQDLRGRSGTGHGNLHWTANFDELQDFVIDIVEEFGGRGFLPPGESPNPPLGPPNAGRAQELDELAAYMSSLDTASLPKSPWRQADGRMSDQALAGAAVFSQLGCAGCHDPLTDYTDSTLGEATLHDVGTLRTSSGFRLGQSLTGISTQTLLGIWDTPPYFHDGSATTLEAVFSVAGGTIYQAEDGVLGGGASVPNWIEINWDSSAHGRLVELGNNGAHVIFNNVDGGSGGLGSIELRYLPQSGGEVQLSVNGSPFEIRSFSQQRTHFEWSRMRFDNVPLNPGTSNSIEVRRISATSWQAHALDHITVSRSEELSLAQPHRIAGGLDEADFQRLLRYLRELDGRDANGQIVNPDLLFRDRFQ